MSIESSSTNIININPGYSKLINPLSKLEYDVLKNSINNKGLHLPIIVNQDNVILDGHNRLKICQELGIEPKFEVKKFLDQLQEKEFVIEINLKRRHLNNFQIAELEYKMEEIYKERAKQRSLSNLKNVKENISIAPNDALELDKGKDETGKVSEIIAKKVGLSPRTYERAKTIIENGSEEVKEKLRQGKTKISKEYEKIQRDSKRQELLSQLNNIQSNKNNSNHFENCKLFLGDFMEQSQKEIADSSIDLIFTDPPYAHTPENLLLHKELARLAIRVLKPGDSLVFYVGHIILDKVIMIFSEYYSIDNNNTEEANYLKFWWPMIVKHSGHHTKIFPRHVFSEQKPLLWYIKGNKVNDHVIANTMGDHIESTPPSKLHHEWQQSTTEADYIIEAGS